MTIFRLSARPLQSVSALVLGALLTLTACQGGPAVTGQSPSAPTHDSLSEPSTVFPTAETTGPQISTSHLKRHPSLSSATAGEVIERLDIHGGIEIEHDNVTVRNVRVTQQASGPGQYALAIDRRSDGTCPSNILVEHIEVIGDTDVLAPGTKAVYGECPFTLRFSRIHHVATGVRITDGTIIEGNYILADHWQEGDDAHRSGLGLNGGAHNVIKGNTIICEGPGCSGALVIYGDFARPEDVLVQGNVFATTGSYCTYAGSLDSKAYPVALDVRYIGNSFSREFYPTCGRYGPVAGVDSGGGPGFVWEGNVWLDTSEEVTLGGATESENP